MKEQMKKQKELIHNEDWSFLIILDACRYDFFRDFNILEGELNWVESEAGHTYPWLQRTVPDKYDWRVFSCHGLINDIGLTPSQVIPSLHTNSLEDEKWIATEHFNDIIEIGFNKEENTREPKRETLNELVHVLKKEDFKEKNLIWITAPHSPFLEKDKDKPVIEAYMNLLKFTFDKLKEFPPMDGKVIISADHGQSFHPPEWYVANKGYCNKREILAHEPAINIPDLRVVPWFEWNKFGRGIIN